jgi:hypothetical protein
MFEWGNVIEPHKQNLNQQIKKLADIEKGQESENQRASNKERFHGGAKIHLIAFCLRGNHCRALYPDHSHTPYL